MQSLCGSVGSDQQVVSDWHGVATKSDGVEMTEDKLALYKSRAAKCMLPCPKQAEGGADGAEKRVKPKSMRDAYLANKENVRALDHSLRTLCENGLATFLPDRPLESHGKEEMYTVAMEELDEEERGPTTDRTLRVCTQNATTGETRLAIINGERNPTLWIHCDRGSIGFPGKIRLFSPAVGLVGDVIPDLSHRRNNGYLHAWHASGLSIMKIELGIIYNLRRGPFAGASNFHSLQGAAQQMYRSLEWNNVIFRFAYDRIAADRSYGKASAAIGSEEHMKELWHELREGGGIAGGVLGTHMKLSRWFSWNTRCRSLQPVMSELMMVLIFIGLVDGWFEHLEELPFVAPAEEIAAVVADGDPAEGEMILPPEVIGAAPAEKAAVHGDRDGLESARKKTKNLKLALNVLLRPASTCIAIAMRVASDPIEEMHRMELTEIGTRVGLRRWALRAASGGFKLGLSKVFGVLSDDGVLREVGFPGDDMLAPRDPEAKEWQQLAKIVFDLVRTTAAEELRHMSYHSERPPFKFISLLDEDEGVKAATLLWAEKLWNTLMDFEEAAAKNGVIAEKMASFLNKVLWTKNQWVRKVFIGLWEANFRAVPPDIAEEIQDFADGWHSSVPCENVFRVLHAAEKFNPSGHVGVKTRWHRALMSGIVEDLDRVLPDRATPFARAVKAPRLRNKPFFSKGDDFSLGAASLAMFEDKARSY